MLASEFRVWERAYLLSLYDRLVESDTDRHVRVVRFSKLFMALLQTEFSKNEDAKVKSVINDQVCRSVVCPIYRRDIAERSWTEIVVVRGQVEI
jgi:hypothetical protein